MSTKPNPVALTAVLLTQGVAEYEESIGLVRPYPSPYTIAQLASAIHRLAPACKRLAEAECNGEWRDGQRQDCYRDDRPGSTFAHTEALDKSISDYATRLGKRIAKLNTQLQPFGFMLVRHVDPRGHTLIMINDTDGMEVLAIG